MDDDRDWECHQQNISHGIGDSHGKKLRVTLPALRSWIRFHLPVVFCGMAFGQGSNEDHEEGDDEEDADGM